MIKLSERQWWLKIEKMKEQYEEYYVSHGEYPQDSDLYLEALNEVGCKISVHDLIIEMICFSDKIGFEQTISFLDFFALVTGVYTSFGEDKSKFEKFRSDEVYAYRLIEAFKKKYKQL